MYNPAKAYNANSKSGRVRRKVDDLLKFEIPIEPRPQSRPRAGLRGRHAMVYEDSKMVAWRNSCTMLVKQLYDGPYLDGPIKVDMTFYMQAPKTFYNLFFY